VKLMARCLCCKLICYLSVVYGNGDGGGVLYAGMGGMGTVVCGMDWDGDDLETSCGDRGGGGD